MPAADCSFEADAALHSLLHHSASRPETPQPPLRKNKLGIVRDDQAAAASRRMYSAWVRGARGARKPQRASTASPGMNPPSSRRSPCRQHPDVCCDASQNSAARLTSGWQDDTASLASNGRKSSQLCCYSLVIIRDEFPITVSRRQQCPKRNTSAELDRPQRSDSGGKPTQDSYNTRGVAENACASAQLPGLLQKSACSTQDHSEISGRSRQTVAHTRAAVPAVTSLSSLALASSLGSIRDDTPLRSSHSSDTLRNQQASHLLDDSILQICADVASMRCLNSAKQCSFDLRQNLRPARDFAKAADWVCTLPKSNLQTQPQERRWGAPKFASRRRHRAHVRPSIVPASHGQQPPVKDAPYVHSDAASSCIMK